MSATLKYIDSYFNNELTPSEKAAFENRCEADTEFAGEVAFYISARGTLKDELHAQKKNEFDTMYREVSASQTKASKGILRKMFPYIAAAAAACLIILLSLQFLWTGSSPQDKARQFADSYINENLAQPGTLMGGEKDSLQSGIEAFKKKNYKEAEKIFQALAAANNIEAIKNLGALYLVTGNYDKAIVQFDKLANQKNLYSNPGLFYKAVTLMKRGEKGDEEEAKRLLQEVIQKDLAGKKEAAMWIQNL